MAYEDNDLSGLIGSFVEPNGPFRSSELRVEIVNGEERVMRILHGEIRGPDGIINVMDQIVYLCQGCHAVWLTPGTDELSWNGRVLCGRCTRTARFWNFLRPLLAPFFKFDQE
jgi:hypothetical protein